MKKNRRSCLIYSQDGFDADVLMNLSIFYERLGFDVRTNSEIEICDLLVVTRIGNPAYSCDQILRRIECEKIHVYDYVGWDASGFAVELQGKDYLVICVSEQLRQRWILSNLVSADRVVVAYLPVVTDLWVNPIRKERYRAVHIGNKKRVDDQWYCRLNDAVECEKIHVWGGGWGEKNAHYHGSADLKDVSTIYSRSRIALGAMYPFQRDVTYSGRFWHGPLNGCVIVSEPSRFAGVIPGTIVSDFDAIDADVLDMECGDRQATQNDAIHFWECENSKLIEIVKADVLGLNVKKTIAAHLGCVWREAVWRMKCKIRNFRMEIYGK